MTRQQDVLTMPHEQIEGIQLAGIKKTVVRCYENIPFYHDLFDKAGFDPYAVESFEDLAKIYNGIDSISTAEKEFGKAKILDGTEHYYSLVIHKKHLDISADGKSIHSTDLKLSDDFYGLKGFVLGDYDLGQLIVYSFGNFIRKESEKNWNRLKAWQRAFFELQKKAKETTFERYQKI